MNDLAIDDMGSFWFTDKIDFVHGSVCYGGCYIPLDYRFKSSANVWRNRDLFILYIEDE